MDKEKARAYGKKARSSMPISEYREASVKIKDYVKAECEHLKENVVYIYVSCNREADTLELISDLLLGDIKVAVPKVNSKDKSMEFYYIQALSDMKKGYMNIPEPVTNDVAQEPGIMVMPMVAFDTNGNRAGYGGGYYDRYLETNGEHLHTIGIAFSCQQVDCIETNPYDIKPRIIITENGKLEE